MLIQSPADDMRGIYIQYIFENQKTQNAYIALKRLAEKYIENKSWDSAANVFKEYKKYFKEKNKEIDEIIKT